METTTIISKIYKIIRNIQQKIPLKKS